jgi:hypothetical protein
MSSLIAIHIKPAAVFTHEAAALVQSHRCTRHTVARHKLYLGYVNPCDFVLAHLKP